MTNVAGTRDDFNEWKEDATTVELTLPLPSGTSKKELSIVMTEKKITVCHARTERRLLHIEPLAGFIVPEESTWYLQHNNLKMDLSKGGVRNPTLDDPTKWGKSLTVATGWCECYLTPAEIIQSRWSRERDEMASDKVHHERVKASEEERREKEAREAEKREAVKKEEAESKAKMAKWHAEFQRIEEKRSQRMRRYKAAGAAGVVAVAALAIGMKQHEILDRWGPAIANRSD